MNALLSIKPEFVEKIFSGEKRFEFRKSVFRQNISYVIVYASSPICRIVGEFEVEDVLQAPPRQLWQKTKDAAGVSKSFFFNYFSGKKYAVAIKIGKLKRYEKPIDPYREFGDRFTPPQSFRYV